jgi:hypothetical protein
LTEAEQLVISVAMPTNSPSVTQLKRAIVIAESIQKLQAELDSILGSPAGAASGTTTAKPSTAKPAKRGKRTMSPEARERIAAAQRARWAKAKGTTGATPAAATPKADAKPAGKAKEKRKITPEGRAKMAAAARKRWAAKKK